MVKAIIDYHKDLEFYLILRRCFVMVVVVGHLLQGSL